MNTNKIWESVIAFYHEHYDLPDDDGDYRGICFVIDHMFNEGVLTQLEYKYASDVLEDYGNTLEAQYNILGKRIFGELYMYFWSPTDKQSRLDWLKQQIK